MACHRSLYSRNRSFHRSSLRSRTVIRGVEKQGIHPFLSSSGNGGVGGFARVTATPVLYSLILSDVLIGDFDQQIHHIGHGRRCLGRSFPGILR